MLVNVRYQKDNEANGKEKEKRTELIRYVMDRWMGIRKEYIEY